MTDEFIAGDVRFAARVRSEGPSIVLLHGFPDTLETWTMRATVGGAPGLEDRLVADGYRTIALAMRGYAPSGIPSNGDYSLRALASDVIATLDQFGIERGMVVGHDWGASASYAAAALHPERIERMVTLAIPPFPVLPSGACERIARPHNFYLAWGRTSAWWLRRDRAAWVRHLYRAWSPDAAIPADHIEQVRHALTKPDRAAAAVGYYAAGVSELDREAIERPIEVPTLAIYGTNEPRTRREAFARALPSLGVGSRIKALPGVGHWPHLEAPERVSKLVSEWLAVR